jgi:arsenate reductase-like glutaredoxin family protein
LISLAGDRFDEIRSILQRPFTQEELIDLLQGNYDNIIKLIEEELDKQKEKEIKEPPINRIQYFEKILRKLFYLFKSK